MNFRLADLPIYGKLTVSFFLFLLGLSYLAATSLIFLSIGKGQPPTPDDIQDKYGGKKIAIAAGERPKTRLEEKSAGEVRDAAGATVKKAGSMHKYLTSLDPDDADAKPDAKRAEQYHKVIRAWLDIAWDEAGGAQRKSLTPAAGASADAGGSTASPERVAAPRPPPPAMAPVMAAPAARGQTKMDEKIALAVKDASGKTLKKAGSMYKYLTSLDPDDSDVKKDAKRAEGYHKVLTAWLEIAWQESQGTRVKPPTDAPASAKTAAELDLDRAMTDAATLSFEQFHRSYVAVILTEHCVRCHGPDVQEKNLRLDSIAAMKKHIAFPAAAAPPMPMPAETKKAEPSPTEPKKAEPTAPPVAKTAAELDLDRAMADAATLSFEEYHRRYVSVILADHCVSCHGPESQEEGLRLDSIAAMKKVIALPPRPKGAVGSGPTFYTEGGMSPEKMALHIHIHAMTMAVMGFAAAVLMFFTGYANWLKLLTVPWGLLGAILDIASWVLMKTVTANHPEIPFAFLTMIGGGIFGTALGLQIMLVLASMWCGSRSPDAGK